MAKLDDLFRMMVGQKASDLHLSTGSQPSLRLHGDIQRLDMRNLTGEECQALIFEILNEKNRKAFIDNWELDCVYELEGVGRFRCNVFMQRKGIAAVFRHIPSKILTVKDLNLPKALMDMISVPKGLILVTGPTGSGKSTTLAALIDHLNATEKLHILTIEDPIEFTHENKMSIVNQREVGGHTKSFAKALKASLREDPDIILVGEMRDIETISLAITAAETGHLVFGTLHTMNAPKTVDRIIDVFPEDRQAQIRVMLAESLRGVVAQGLLKTSDNSGRVAALEILFNTRAVANLIREGKTFQIPSSMQTGKAEGMQTFADHVDQLINSGKITKETGYGFLGKAVESSGAEGNSSGYASSTSGGMSGSSSAGSSPGHPPGQHPGSPPNPLSNPLNNPLSNPLTNPLVNPMASGPKPTGSPLNPFKKSS